MGLCGAFQVAPRIHRPQLGLVLVLAHGSELAMDAEVYDAHSLDRGQYGLDVWWAMIRRRDIRGRRSRIEARYRACMLGRKTD